MNTAAEQLQGWKDIACYLKCPVRCVQQREGVHGRRVAVFCSVCSSCLSRSGRNAFVYRTLWQ